VTVSSIGTGDAGPSVSLLMPNRNNGPILEHVLDRLATNTTYSNLELVVIDDGSTDDSRAILRRWRDSGRFAAFRLIERDHAGVIDALNTGLHEAGGELIVQLDADASVETPGWVERMVAFFRSDARVGVATAKVVFDSGDIQACGVNIIGPDGLHGRGTVITEPVGRRTYHERVARFKDGECLECEAPAEVDAGIGCCMMYRREVALELGGYDPGYAPVWFDDLDLTLSIRRHGLKVFFMPDVHVIHHAKARVTVAPGGRRALEAMRRLARATVAPRLRHRLARTLDLQPREVRDRLAHHYDYWHQKWGFDLLNPDMDAVIKRWGQTEICWRYNEQTRKAGDLIAAEWRSVAKSGRE
jgi:GT2 family glycosyltransferase